VTPHLDALGAPWTLLATDQLGASAALSWETEGNGHGYRQVLTTSDGIDLELSRVTAVWNRRRPVNPGHTSPTTGTPEQDRFIREQRAAMLAGAVDFIDGIWVNSPQSLRAARSKLEQLARAASFGLRVPETLASDDPSRVRRFCDHHRGSGVITKLVSPGPPIAADPDRQYMVFTRRFDPDTVHDAQIRAAPAIYQVEIRESFEVRVVVVGERQFACSIDSQASAETELDWRHYDFENVGHELIRLPDEVAGKIQRMCASYGLRFAAIDLARTPEGDWVFFEINPNGQWAWLEELSGAPIGEALAHELAGVRGP
jgi:hypothetical protein